MSEGSRTRPSKGRTYFIIFVVTSPRVHQKHILQKTYRYLFICEVFCVVSCLKRGTFLRHWKSSCTLINSYPYNIHFAFLSGKCKANIIKLSTGLWLCWCWILSSARVQSTHTKSSATIHTNGCIYPTVCDRLQFRHVSCVAVRLLPPYYGITCNAKRKQSFPVTRLRREMKCLAYVLTLTFGKPTTAELSAQPDPREFFWYSFLLETEWTTGLAEGLGHKNPPGIEPETSALWRIASTNCVTARRGTKRNLHTLLHSWQVTRCLCNKDIHLQ